ncbi:twin-arginine translocase TatA/TatE family subunit [Salibacter sp.]|jgi:sec-independent protein translocase protein TatA|uniref:Sec-independent protein translocase subunit TatA/TatB n=1 Tax=Salibacter sp. TaxID=2010995 RepID=UPI00286FC026|nr:twin-arginine translocase TatA/TatE family subunit [Salibacter sp.]MDR9397959.1 twin-arginine translocase TatA/TatE family subunit [Salibacter sp.]MDR9486487.1 twin-arginine translocase TatA/TatE family subunit [Salibacter sp.]
MTLLFFDLGGGEVFMILFIVLLLFGAKKIPEFARGLGKGIRYIKNATDDIQRDIQNNMGDVKNDLDVNRKLYAEKRDQDPQNQSQSKSSTNENEGSEGSEGSDRKESDQESGQTKSD